MDLTDRGDRTTLAFRVTTRAPRCALTWDAAAGFKLRVDAPPVEGLANERVVRFLAREVFRVPVADVALDAGERSRSKRVTVALPVAVARERLEAYFAASAAAKR